MRIFDLKNLKTAAPKEVHKFFNFQLEACGCRVQDFKPVLRLTKAISYFVLLVEAIQILLSIFRLFDSFVWFFFFSFL